MVVEKAGAPEVSGNQLAAPIARAVIEAVLPLRSARWPQGCALPGGMPASR